MVATSFFGDVQGQEVTKDDISGLQFRMGRMAQTRHYPPSGLLDALLSSHALAHSRHSFVSRENLETLHQYPICSSHRYNTAILPKVLRIHFNIPFIRLSCL
jgi:hypothetical protein